ncbi:MAG TPA: adenosylcobinamide-GDP ribazoletransferase [Anaerolineae bacterium]|nr:adenosylcobinamide-GDP ribazoletransferase [Anaerolineae bacterium]
MFERIRREWDVWLTAVMFFTRIPLPAWLGYRYEAAHLQSSARYFSLVGWVVGGFGAAVFWVGAQVWGDVVGVVLSMMGTILLTGAFHEDGLADVCDGFWGGMTAERVLEIMKDSRLGTYGTLGLGLVLSLKGVVLVGVAEVGLVPVLLLVGHVVSRWGAGTLLYTDEYARADDLSKSKPLATQMTGWSVLVLTGWMVLAVVTAGWWRGMLWPGLVVGVVAVVVVRTVLSRWYRQRLGGYTGDCLGAVQQMSEVCFYLGVWGVVR